MSETLLQSALEKLADDSGKSTHLSPRECAAVLDYIRDLEMDSAELSNFRADVLEYIRYLEMDSAELSNFRADNLWDGYDYGEP